MSRAIHFHYSDDRADDPGKLVVSIEQDGHLLFSGLLSSLFESETLESELERMGDAAIDRGVADLEASKATIDKRVTDLLAKKGSRR